MILYICKIKENAMEMRLKKAREGDKALKANQATQMQQETQKTLQNWNI